MIFISQTGEAFDFEKSVALYLAGIYFPAHRKGWTLNGIKISTRGKGDIDVLLNFSLKNVHVQVKSQKKLKNITLKMAQVNKGLKQLYGRYESIIDNKPDDNIQHFFLLAIEGNSTFDQINNMQFNSESERRRIATNKWKEKLENDWELPPHNSTVNEFVECLYIFPTPSREHMKTVFTNKYHDLYPTILGWFVINQFLEDPDKLALITGVGQNIKSKLETPIEIKTLPPKSYPSLLLTPNYTLAVSIKNLTHLSLYNLKATCILPKGETVTCAWDEYGTPSLNILTPSSKEILYLFSIHEEEEEILLIRGARKVRSVCRVPITTFEFRFIIKLSIQSFSDASYQFSLIDWFNSEKLINKIKGKIDISNKNLKKQQLQIQDFFDIFVQFLERKYNNPIPLAITNFENYFREHLNEYKRYFNIQLHDSNPNILIISTNSDEYHLNLKVDRSPTQDSSEAVLLYCDTKRKPIETLDERQTFYDDICQHTNSYFPSNIRVLDLRFVRHGMAILDDLNRIMYNDFPIIDIKFLKLKLKDLQDDILEKRSNELYFVGEFENFITKGLEYAIFKAEPILLESIIALMNLLRLKEAGKYQQLWGFFKETYIKLFQPNNTSLPIAKLYDFAYFFCKLLGNSPIESDVQYFLKIMIKVFLSPSDTNGQIPSSCHDCLQGLDKETISNLKTQLYNEGNDMLRQRLQYL